LRGLAAQRIKDRFADLAAGQIKVVAEVVEFERRQLRPPRAAPEAAVQRRRDDVFNVRKALDVRARTNLHEPPAMNLANQRIHVGEVVRTERDGGWGHDAMA